MSTLAETCLAITKRQYPQGYGFCINYIKQDLNVEDLKTILKIAFDMVKIESQNGNSDATDFVKAFTESQNRIPNGGWPWWLIEAVQLIHAGALRERPTAIRTMKLLNHSGFQ